MIELSALLSAGLVQYCNGGQNSALVGLHNVAIHDHLVQDHVSPVNVEHYLQPTGQGAKPLTATIDNMFHPYWDMLSMLPLVIISSCLLYCTNI